MREFSLRPGQAVRAGDVIVRLRACETTAPWEVQQLTGAFVQVDVRNPQGQFQRVFSGWLYKESPSLNVVEHPIYDVWPMSCAMTHPGGGEPAGRAVSNRSSAPSSAGPAPAAPAPAAPEPAAPAPSAPPPSADANSAR
jgi:pyruvate/2-oxoglutarate dehydrogenase complex dihydrolipoamide acyltransferase (E2) component